MQPLNAEGSSAPAPRSNVRSQLRSHEDGYDGSSGRIVTFAIG